VLSNLSHLIVPSFLPALALAPASAVAMAAVLLAVAPFAWTRPRAGHRRRPSSLERFRSCSGQATAEYALVLLGAAAVALMLTAWAAKSGAIGKLFDAVVDQLIGEVG
jgi:hypothetical protein